jgi:phosphate transport system protein
MSPQRPRDVHRKPHEEHLGTYLAPELPHIEGEDVVLPIPEPPSGAVRAEFHSALDRMDDQFIAAALDVAEELPRLTSAFLLGDRSSVAEAIDLSVRVGDACEQIEEDGFILLAREAPVAGDLRRLVALLRLTTDVDRSASLLKNVSMTLERFDPRFLPEDLRLQLGELADRAADVFNAGIEAWRHRDALAVHDVDDADEAVDRLQQVLLDKAAALDEAGDEMLVLGLIARYYERIADHGVTIARDAAFVATGQRVAVGKRRTQGGESG